MVYITCGRPAGVRSVLSFAAPARSAAISTWGFPKVRCAFLGIPRTGTVVSGGLYWGPFILENYHI